MTKRDFNIGDTYGKWTVVGGIKKVYFKNSKGNPSYRITILCVCECGLEKEIQTRTLYSGSSKSCTKCATKNKKETAFHTHLMSNTKEFRAWDKMKARCYNKKHNGYENYGGRGISVCDRWLNSFENFLADIGKAPSKYHSLDRYPNTNGNYEPGNVRWATLIQQANNTRRNVWYIIDGESKTIPEWCRKYNMPIGTVRHRVNSLGWDIFSAISTPINIRHRNGLYGSKKKRKSNEEKRYF